MAIRPRRPPAASSRVDITSRACDILVVGAGAAGMPAALFAAEGGASVLLAEGDTRIGGTFHVSSGQVSAAGTRLQLAKAIADSPEEHFEDVMRISRGTANPALVRLAVQNAAETLHWLLDNGLELMSDHPVVHLGHEPYQKPRTYWGPEGGRSILKVLAPLVEQAAQRQNFELRLGARLQRLERRSGGGLQALFETDSQSFSVDAAAIILATGGYSAQPTLFSNLSGGKPLHGGGHPMARGDGLLAARRLGATTINEDAYLPAFAAVELPGGSKAMSMATHTYPQLRPPWEIYVDGHGRRFVAEDEPSVDKRERALLAIDDLRFWAIFDDRIRREAPSFLILPEAADDAIPIENYPGYRSAETLRQLADAIHVDAATLASAIETYNSDLLAGNPDRFGRQHRPVPICEPPFHALEHFGWSVAGFAGLAVDCQLRVLDAEQHPIPGLFAAGEILGLAATSGNAYAGGMSVTPAMTFGRLLGQRLAHHVAGLESVETNASLR